MKKVCVAGGGTMGLDIALVMAVNGISVIVKARQVTESYLQNVRSRLTKNAERLLSKGTIDEATKDSALSAISFTQNFKDAADCDLVIDAIVEDVAEKKRLFEEFDKVCGDNTIFATNTSSISITDLSYCTSRPDKFSGMHFFNPATVMKPVEIVRSAITSDATFDAVKQLAEFVGKEPVAVNESPGFVVNRILIPMINEAIGVLADGVASAEDIDKLMKLGANHPMGPLALSDLIGNDVVLNIMDTLQRETGDQKYRPHTLLRKMVRSKFLGKKNGKGFYVYTK